MIQQENDFDEIARIAVCLRILFQNKGQSKSLLLQVNPSLKILDTCPQFDIPTTNEKLISQYAAGLVTLNPSYGYILTPTQNPRWVSINDWWETTLFFDQDSFTRKDLILFVANTDGGGHVDPGSPEKYYAMKEYGSIATLW